MLESEKLIQIVQTWLGYIRLEELTQAEVERSSDIYSKVVDKGVQLVGNKLLLDSEVFTQFQQQQQAAKRGNKAIIFSPYQCHQEHSFWFLNRKPNLLNTAVSRARELFVLVGNLRELELAGGETKRLVEHIRQHGEIRT